MPLPTHPAFKALEDLLRTEKFAQRDLIRLLRATLNGHVRDEVVETFRTLKVATDGETNAVIAKGREAVDRRIQRAVTEATGGLVPDQIEVTVPVFDLDELRDPAHLQPVSVLVETSSDEDGRPLFELTTVLNSLRAARYEALMYLDNLLQERIRADDYDYDIRVYHGTI